MKELEEIAQVTGSFLPDFIKKYQEVLTSNDPLIDQALSKIKSGRGKHIRPILLALVVKLLGHEITSSEVDAAVLLELLHCASLIHDDVIDLSPLRRGEPTLNSIYGNHISVLVGDYILAKCFHHAVRHCSQSIMEVVALAGMYLSTGELYQAKATQGLQVITEKEYFNIIQKKTGTLFEATTQIGALCAKSAMEDRSKLANLGRLLGLAFQIKDDIFDFYDDPQKGKPAGLDLAEGKITLPLIYTFYSAENALQKEVKILLDQAQASLEARKRLVKLAHDSGGLNYAQEKLKEILHQADAIIHEFSPSPAQEALLKLCDFLYFRSF